jgi:hypothetical protein
VLPGVNAEDGTELADHGVLVGVCLDADVAGLHVLHQPCPAGALDTGESGVELALQLLERAVGVVDLLGESAGWGLAAALGLGCEVLPEEGVVDISTWGRMWSVGGRRVVLASFAKCTYHRGS